MYRNVSSVMLMGIYLEDGNYARAEAMLDETFKLRSSKKESSVRTYFALAGQAVNGARAHVGRYRSFGINVANAALPPEATTDLDRLGSLLERSDAQPGAGAAERPRQRCLRTTEDIAGIRTTIARDDEDVRAGKEVEAARRAQLCRRSWGHNQSFSPEVILMFQ